MLYKFNDFKRARFLGCLRQGMRRGAAAKAAGIDRGTVCNFAKENPEFRLEMDQAEADACEILEDVVFKKALDGDKTLLIFYLTNRCPDRWKHMRQQIVQQTITEPNQDATLKQILQRLKDAGE